MDITPDPVRTALIGAFLDHERAVEGLAAQTLRHCDLHLRTFFAWWDREHPDCPPHAASTADLAAFLVAETDRRMSAYTRVLDGLYVVLAQDRGAPLVSADQRLARGRLPIAVLAPAAV